MPVRRVRTLRVCKWLAAGATALILIAWPASRYWMVAYTSDVPVNPVWGIRIAKGEIFISRGLYSTPVGWIVQYLYPPERQMSWWPFLWRKARWLWYVGVPLWIPVVLLAGVAALLFWKDRPIAPGYCPQCRYNLTGNVSGICPECGRSL